jgi:hypothetical protein
MRTLVRWPTEHLFVGGVTVGRVAPMVLGVLNIVGGVVLGWPNIVSGGRVCVCVSGGLWGVTNVTEEKVDK